LVVVRGPHPNFSVPISCRDFLPFRPVLLLHLSLLVTSICLLLLRPKVDQESYTGVTSSFQVMETQPPNRRKRSASVVQEEPSKMARTQEPEYPKSSPDKRDTDLYEQSLEDGNKQAQDLWDDTSTLAPSTRNSADYGPGAREATPLEVPWPGIALSSREHDQANRWRHRLQRKTTTPHVQCKEPVPATPSSRH
jgi:hypothetical protein